MERGLRPGSAQHTSAAAAYNVGMHAILIAGAALVGLPILLHLIMKQEPKRLTFPAFRFLTQKLKTNQRKLRLRHFILLALRMLLIALFCLALYQPTLLSERLNLERRATDRGGPRHRHQPEHGLHDEREDAFRGGQATGARTARYAARSSRPSPSSRPTTSRPRWMDKSEARKQIERLDKPRGGSQPTTSAIAVAYQLFGKIETDVEEADRLPKLVAIFTDRTAASWDTTRAEEIKKLRDTLPDPKPSHIVFDVGAEHPTDVAILAAEMKPQVLSANQPAVVTVTVAATGPTTEPAVEAAITATLDGIAATPKRVMLPYGQSRSVTFQFDKLKPGLHQVEFNLATSDKLMFNNSRYLTFKVGAARCILTIAESEEAAANWQSAHTGKDGFGCLVVKPDDVRIENGRTVVRYPNPENPEGPPADDDIRGFDVVCLLGIRDPSDKAGGLDSLWDKVRPYVQGGGKLLIIPGGEQISKEGYASGRDLMPGTLEKVIDTSTAQIPPPKQTAPGWSEPREGTNGVTWFLDDDKILQHPMLRPFLEWKKAANIDVWVYPRRTKKYWEVKKAPRSPLSFRTTTQPSRPTATRPFSNAVSPIPTTRTRSRGRSSCSRRDWTRTPMANGTTTGN